MPAGLARGRSLAGLLGGAASWLVFRGSRLELGDAGMHDLAFRRRGTGNLARAERQQ